MLSLQAVWMMQPPSASRDGVAAGGNRRLVVGDEGVSKNPMELKLGSGPGRGSAQVIGGSPGTSRPMIL